MKRDLAFVYVAYAARMAAPLLLIPLYGRVLGKHDYGVLLAAISLGQLVWAVCDWGFPFSGTRAVAGAQSAAERSRLLHTHLAARAALLLVVAPVCALIGYGSPLLRDQAATVVWAIAFGGVSSTNLTWYYQGIESYREPAAIELLGIALSTAGIVVALALLPSPWVVPCVLSGVGAAMSGLSYLRVRPVGAASGVGARDVLQLIRESTQLFAYRSSLVLLMPTTTLTASYLLAPAVAAQYAIVDKLISTAAAMLTPLSQMFVGSVNARVARNRETPLVYIAHMRQLVLVMTTAALCIGGAIALSSELLLAVLFGPDFVDLAPYLAVCAAVIPFATLAAASTSYVLVPLKRDALASATGVFALLSNLALFALGCLFFGIWGACAARAAASALRAGVVAMALHRAGMLWRLLKGR